LEDSCDDGNFQTSKVLQNWYQLESENMPRPLPSEPTIHCSSYGTVNRLRVTKLWNRCL